jgi:competence protein ComEA
MDPEAKPWRTIDAASTATAASDRPAAPAGRRVVSTGTLAVIGAAVLIGVAAFVLAFGSTGAGAIEIEGGAPLGAAGSGSSGSTGGGLVSSNDATVVVEVVGAVVKPGVYRLPVGSRVDDLLAAAGGYGPRVDTERAADALNRAAVLADGAQVRVPSRDDPVSTGGTGGHGGSGSAAPGLLDLNTATSAELEALPGIGPVTANKIITSREEARFVAVDDLRSRKLLGEKTFDGLKDLVTVR